MADSSLEANDKFTPTQRAIITAEETFRLVQEKTNQEVILW